MIALEFVRRNRLVVVIVALLMAIHFVLARGVIRAQTPTVDEVAHIPAGLSYLETGSFRMYRFSPPLARLLPALAASALSPHQSFEGTWAKHTPVNHWLFAFEFLTANGETDADRRRCLDLFTRARTVVAAVSALTIPIMFAWGMWWSGRNTGLLAAALWALSPNIIAHASLATTDLFATSFGLFACFGFALWLARPNWGRAILAGVLLGLAQLTKFSLLWLYGLFPLWALIALWLTESGGWLALIRRLRAPWLLFRANQFWQFVLIVAVSVLVINAGYLGAIARCVPATIAAGAERFDSGWGVEGFGTPLGDFPFVCDLLTRPRTLRDAIDGGSSAAYNLVHQARVNRFRGTWLGLLPCPLPYHYVAGFDEQKFEADGGSIVTRGPEGSGYEVYLRGQLQRRGWRYYYLYALLIKLPLSTWILLVSSTAMLIRNMVRSRRAMPQERGASLGPWLILAIAPIAAMSLLTDINLGLRYVLTALPFLFLIAAALVRDGAPKWAKAVALLAVTWNLGVIARIHPHELSYFNEIVGGPRNGRLHLIDSNLDWGQDLRGLARWIESHPEWKDVRLAYMGSVPPEFEGIEPYRMAPRDLRRIPQPLRLPWEIDDDPTTYGPQQGKFAVSVNFERGLVFHTPCPLDRLEEVRQKCPFALMAGTPMINRAPEAYNYFQHFTPRIEPAVGYSILLYDISLEEANRVRAKLGLPLLP